MMVNGGRQLANNGGQLMVVDWLMMIIVDGQCLTLVSKGLMMVNDDQ